jgi:hypothetical protein
MKINISKDIDSFNKNNFWKGLSKRELVHAVLCIAIGIIVVAVLEDEVGIDAASYMAMFAVAPIGLNGFYKKNGMYFGQYIREYRKQNSFYSKLTFGSYDREMLVSEIEGKRIEKEADNEEKK